MGSFKHKWNPGESQPSSSPLVFINESRLWKSKIVSSLGQPPCRWKQEEFAEVEKVRRDQSPCKKLFVALVGFAMGFEPLPFSLAWLQEIQRATAKRNQAVNIELLEKSEKWIFFGLWKGRLKGDMAKWRGTAGALIKHCWKENNRRLLCLQLWMEIEPVKILKQRKASWTPFQCKGRQWKMLAGDFAELWSLEVPKRQYQTGEAQVELAFSGEGRAASSSSLFRGNILFAYCSHWYRTGFWLRLPYLRCSFLFF